MGMTTKEAIKVLRTESVEIGGNAVSVTRWLTAFDVAIKALDAVPVVRCRECKRFDRDNVICKMWLHVVASNDFCSYGEKEGAYNDT